MKYRLFKFISISFPTLIFIFLNSSSKAEFYEKNISDKDPQNFDKAKTINSNETNNLFAEVSWEKVNQSQVNEKPIIWKKYNTYVHSNEETIKKEKTIKLNSLGRSIVFDDLRVGPDISWIVPPGLAWNKKYRFDLLARGHNTRIPEPKNKNFFAWNDGDAVGLLSYQFLHFNKSSLGINLGVRSLYQGKEALGGATSIGEGLSSGFRWDYSLTDRSGIAFGAEQLIHFDSSTDTGRNIYFTASKAWWRGNDELGRDSFPLYIATTGLSTGRMAVGTVKGLCSDLFDGSGTETQAKRPLCWAPVFSLARVHNEKLSSYFEYNSRFFLLGSSLAPFSNIPIRGNLALIISDHIDNYKLHDFSELNWVFNISLGF